MKGILSLVALLALVFALTAAAQQTQQAYPSGQDPSGTTNQQPTGTTMAQQQSGTTTETPSTTTSSTENTTSKSSMPKTASPLPLVGLSGLSAMASGMWLSRRRKA